jgi:membrane protein YqaA with SNARE-associated domain
MDFVIQWLCCLAAFVLGSLLAWLIAVFAVKATSEAEALGSPAGTDDPGDRDA